VIRARMLRARRRWVKGRAFDTRRMADLEAFILDVRMPPTGVVHSDISLGAIEITRLYK
jgi:hypothetical protein